MRHNTPVILHELLAQSAVLHGDKPAIGFKQSWLTYGQLSMQCQQLAGALQSIGLDKNHRVAIYLPKTPEAVSSYFSISLCGGILVPVNSALKARQVEHILQDSDASILITNLSRFQQLNLDNLPNLKQVVLVDETFNDNNRVNLWSWKDLISSGYEFNPVQIIDNDIAAIFYTSGSTGKAKGVVLSHKNMVMGAKSVAAYLPCEPDDKMLAVLPFSFDYGFSQLTIALLIGASCYLTEFVFEQDLIKVIVEQEITSLALLPPLWVRLAQCQWPEQSAQKIRYFCNSGGAMPQSTLAILRRNMPQAQPYLMYGLTEAFRSCYLPPDEIDKRPTSFGRAIPNAEILVINDQGKECEPFEQGELVHRGVLVGQGYWNEPIKTAERFKPLDNGLPQIPIKEMAVWSGDLVHKDYQGYLYFNGRLDDMIKTSGYRLSPQEVEEVLHEVELVSEAIVVGVNHLTLGQALIAILVVKNETLTKSALRKYCVGCLSAYMVPHKFVFVDSLPRNGNDKYDRRYWQQKYQHYFSKVE